MGGGKTEMGSEKLGDESDNAGQQKMNLSQLTTFLVTRAKAKTKTVRVLEEPELPKDKSVSLLVTAGPLKGNSFKIQKPQVLIGRMGGDIEIPDPKISRNHCVIQVHGLTALLVDLDSVNGTLVNEEKIASCELEHMSEFRIGKTTLMLVFTPK